MAQKMKTKTGPCPHGSTYEWNCAACHDDLHAQVQQLRDAGLRLAAESATEAASLQAEIERLRAALEKIEAGYGQRLSAAELASMARQAL